MHPIYCASLPVPNFPIRSSDRMILKVLGLIAVVWLGLSLLAPTSSEHLAAVERDLRARYESQHPNLALVNRGLGFITGTNPIDRAVTEELERIRCGRRWGVVTVCRINGNLSDFVSLGMAGNVWTARDVEAHAAAGRVPFSMMLAALLLVP